MIGFLLASTSLLATVASAATITVTVGGNDLLAFDPPSVQAQTGDVIDFMFVSRNHTVTSSSFASPCSPLAGNAFDSGFQPGVSTDAPKSVQFVVSDTSKPLWFYCRQKTPASHCAAGMVFAINAPQSGNTFDAFKAAAMSSGSASSSATGGASATDAPTATASDSSSPYPASATPSASASATPPSSGSSTVHTIKVGPSSTNTFEPSNITANVGDVLQFIFQAKNHTVTQSSFTAPCNHLAANGILGFDSGFNPVAASNGSLPQYNVTVNDTKPIWVYCRQIGHCGGGMVFSVNANESSANTFSAFQSKAKQINGTGTSGGSPNATGTGPAGSTPSNGAFSRVGGVGPVELAALVGAVFLGVSL